MALLDVQRKPVLTGIPLEERCRTIGCCSEHSKVALGIRTVSVTAYCLGCRHKERHPSVFPVAYREQLVGDCVHPTPSLAADLNERGQRGWPYPAKRVSKRRQRHDRRFAARL